jgi:outer membrane protein
MKTRNAMLAILPTLAFTAAIAVMQCVVAQEALAQNTIVQGESAPEKSALAPRHLTLEEAVQLALQHNHLVRISQEKINEQEHGKALARSAYFPVLANHSSLAKVTDTEFIGIPAGSLGSVGGTSLPGREVILNQGGKTLIISGTSLTQPLSDLFKVKSANDVAAAEVRATRDQAQQTRNAVALQVHQIYYRILIAQSHREAALAKIRSTEALASERVEQVKYGSTLEEESIESRAQALEAKQDLLTTELQLSDLTIQLDDAIGLPLTTPLVLDAGVHETGPNCDREECLRLALEAHPEIAEARAEVEKAEAAVRYAKRQYIPNVEAFASYAYQDNIPFFARNSGTFGVHFGYDLFDGGKRNAEIGEHRSQVKQAEENLARIKDEVEVRVQTAWNKLERTRQMVHVSEELVALRTESQRVTAEQLAKGAALHSQADSAAAQALLAKTMLLQSQLDYLQARDEMTEALGQTPQ